MTFSYTDPSASSNDAVRFLLRDTVDAGHLLENEEITWLLSENTGDVYAAAADGAMSVSMSFARKASSKSVGPLSLQWSNKAEEWKLLAADLRRRSMLKTPATPYAGGISVADKEIDENDDDTFHGLSVGGMDNPGAAGYDDETKVRDRNRGTGF